MVIDKKGNILTCSELKNMPIENITININATKILTKHIEDLAKYFENTTECQGANKRYNFYIEELIKLLPDNKKDLLIKLDDYYTEMLILHDEYYYKDGYIDGLKSKKVFKKLILTVKAISDKLLKKC